MVGRPSRSSASSSTGIRAAAAVARCPVLDDAVLAAKGAKDALEGAMVAQDAAAEAGDDDLAAVADGLVAAAGLVVSAADDTVRAARDVSSASLPKDAPVAVLPAAAPPLKHAGTPKAGVTLDEACAAVSVCSTSPATVSFFKAAANNPAVADVAVAMLDALATSLGKYTETSEQSRERSAVLELLLGLDAGRRADLTMLLSAVDAGTGRVASAVASEAERAAAAQLRDTAQLLSAVDAGAGRVASAVAFEAERAAAAQQREIVQLAAAVDSALRGALENVSTDAIARRVAEAVQSAVAEVRDGQKEQRDILADLRRSIHDEMENHVLAPIAAKHEHVASLLAVMPERVSAICAAAKGEKDILDGITTLRSRLDDVTGQHSRDLAAVNTLLNGRVAGEVTALRDTLKAQGDQLTMGLPACVSDALGTSFRELQRQGTVLQTRLDDALSQLKGVEAHVRDSSGKLSLLEKGGDSVLGKVDGIMTQLTTMQVRQTSHLRAKGVGGESRLHELLCERLRVRDGFVVEVVAGQAHGCDIVVRRAGGFTDVRIECKVYTDKVGVKELDKFRRDLLGLNTHGVFVSIQSGIVGMAELEFEQLPTGRFAVYLSNNHFNVDIVADWISVMHKIERMACPAEDSHETGSTVVRVPEEVMREVHRHLLDFSSKVGLLKVNLRECMALLNQLTLDHVERLLRGCEPKNKAGLAAPVAAEPRLLEGAPAEPRLLEGAPAAPASTPASTPAVRPSEAAPPGITNAPAPRVTPASVPRPCPVVLPRAPPRPPKRLNGLQLFARDHPTISAYAAAKRWKALGNDQRTDYSIRAAELYA